MAEKLSSNIKIIIEILAKGKEKAKALAREIDGISDTSLSAGRNVSATDRAVSALGNSSSKASGKIGRLNDEVSGLDKSSKGAAGSIGAIAVKLGKMVAIAGSIAYVGKAAIDFESTMADVRKVVDGTEGQISSLRTEILQMTREIPRSATELGQIAAAAGQLGIKTNDIKGFTETVAKMSTAFDMSAEDAGTAIGKIKNIFGLSIDQLGTFGDTVNQLGNTTAAKEKEIVDAMMRIGGSAKQFGLAVPEAAALTAAFISLGKPPEVAGSAINAMLAKLQTAESQGPKFQQALINMGTTSTKLADDIKKGPQQAITGFLDTLKKVEDSDRAKILVDLFGLEYQDDIGILVTGLDSYKDSLNQVANASTYAGSMQKEFEARAKTTANSIQITKNAINEAAINLGTVFLPAINMVLMGFAGLTQSLVDFMKAHPAFSKALEDIGAGINSFYTDLADSWVGEAVSASIKTIIASIEELGMSLESGEMKAKLESMAKLWQPWADDVAFSIRYIKAQFSGNFDEIGKLGEELVGWLIKAFQEFPPNVRALIGLATVGLASEFDKMKAKAVWLMESIKAIFTESTLEEAADQFIKQMNLIDKAKWESADAIIKERDLAIDSYKQQTEAARKLREEHEALKRERDNEVEREKNRGPVKAAQQAEEEKKDKEKDSALAPEKKAPKPEEEKDFSAKEGKGEGQQPSKKNDEEYQKQLELKRKTYSPEEFAERKNYWKSIEDERPLSKTELAQKREEESKFKKEQAEVAKQEREEKKKEAKEKREEAAEIKKRRGRRKRGYDDDRGFDENGVRTVMNKDGSVTETSRVVTEDGTKKMDREYAELFAKNARLSEKAKVRVKGGISAHGGELSQKEWEGLSKEQQEQLTKKASTPSTYYDYFSNKSGDRLRGVTDPTLALKQMSRQMVNQNKTKADQKKWLEETTKAGSIEGVEADRAKRKEEDRVKDEGRKKRQAELDEEDRKTNEARANSAKTAEEIAMAANRARTELAIKTAQERAAAEIAATEKSKSVFQQYFDRVRQLQDEIVGREETLADKLAKMNPQGTEESRWQKMRKDAIAYEKAAKAAMALGDYDKAQSMADRASKLYEGLRGGAGGVDKKTGDRAAFAGVKSAGELGIAIAKAQQSQEARAALAATNGSSGPALSHARGAMSQIANQRVDKVHELRFKGGAVQGSGPNVEALLDLLAKEGFATA